jgi:broad specificity phosphatase PhoE
MGNERKIIQDFTSHLSEKGVEQARIVAQRLKEIPLTLVVSSTAQRAMDTARLVAKPHDIALVSSELFAERRHPRNMLGLSQSDSRVIMYRKKVERNIHDPFFRLDGFENFYEMRARALKSLIYLEEVSRKHEHVAVVSHSIFMRYFLGAVMFGDAFYHAHWKPLMKFGTNNTGIAVYDVSADKHKSRWKLTSWNDHAHLPK